MKSKFQSGIALMINPFERIAGWQALGIGVVVMALTAVVGKINHITFLGSVYVDPITTFSFPVAFAIQIINYLLLFLIMWIAGLCFSKSKLRAVDVAGTMALTRIPMLLLSIVFFLPIAPASPYDITRWIVVCLICVPFMIWMVALMYNAYSVSCNMKGSKAIISFIGALIVAEIVIRVVLFFLITTLYTSAPIIREVRFESKENIEAVDSLSIRQKTENVVKAFEQGSFDAITVYFDETMKKKLPSSGLKMIWVQANLTLGKFKKAEFDNLQETDYEKYHIVLIPLVFEKEKRKLQLTFNSKNEISGLFIR